MHVVAVHAVFFCLHRSLIAIQAIIHPGLACPFPSIPGDRPALSSEDESLVPAFRCGRISKRIHLNTSACFIQVLCESLTYNQGKPNMLLGQRVSECIHKYQPPFDEFQVLRVSVTKEGAVDIPAQKSPMVLTCLSCAGSHSLVVRPCCCLVIVLSDITYIPPSTTDSAGKSCLYLCRVVDHLSKMTACKRWSPYRKGQCSSYQQTLR